jgi:hypothetical protein
MALQGRGPSRVIGSGCLAEKPENASMARSQTICQNPTGQEITCQEIT